MRIVRSMPSTARTTRPAGAAASRAARRGSGSGPRGPRGGAAPSRTPLRGSRHGWRARSWRDGRRRAGTGRRRDRRHAGAGCSCADLDRGPRRRAATGADRAPRRPSARRTSGTGGTRPGRRRRTVTSGGTTSVQTGIANAQRGANRQPGGGLRRSGGMPGMTSSVRRSAWMFGKAPSSACVYGCRGVGEHPPDGALLGDPPRVHDQGLVARLGDHRQVVGDQDQRQPEVPAQLLEQLQDLRLDHDVERGRRLVADHDRRVAGERHRDHRALAHPAGQLVRVGVAPASSGSRRGRAARPPASATTRAAGRGGSRSARRSGRRPAGPG